MASGRQSGSVLISWIAVDLAFIVIIVALLGSFAYNGKKASITRCREELAHHVSDWTYAFDEIVSESKSSVNLLSDLLPSADEKKISEYLSVAGTDTVFSHIVYIKDDSSVYDQDGEYTGDLNLSVFKGLKPGSVSSSVVSAGNYTDSAYAVAYGIEDGSQIVFLSTLNDIAERFSSFSYTEYMFMVLVSSDGTVHGKFDKYNDVDSVFLSSPNILSIVSGGAKVDDFTLFKTRLANGSAGAVASTVKNDSRTIVSAPIKNTNLALVLGLRQYYMDKMVKTDFKTTQSTIIRLSVVMILFTLFTFGTLIASSIKHKEHGRELEDKADTDLLTELYNKLATERKIQEYIDEHPKSKGMFFIFDVDNFKKINDTMGHAFGDLMLKTIGTQIRSVFRVTDIIGRVGGDEFIIFLKDINEAEVKEQADRLIGFFHDFKAGGDYVKYSATASIGAALYPDDGKSFKGLYEAADQALYKAKKRGKNRLVFFNEETQEGEEKA